jgi:hypothetical protein
VPGTPHRAAGPFVEQAGQAEVVQVLNGNRRGLALHIADVIAAAATDECEVTYGRLGAVAYPRVSAAAVQRDRPPGSLPPTAALGCEALAVVGWVRIFVRIDVVAAILRDI